MKPRRCSQPACQASAVATLTFTYGDRVAVVGPLSPFPDPNSYDLCGGHAERVSVPRGWELVRVEGEAVPAAPTSDDLEALANAVREAARPPAAAHSRPYLRVLPGG